MHQNQTEIHNSSVGYTKTEQDQFSEIHGNNLVFACGNTDCCIPFSGPVIASRAHTSSCRSPFHENTIISMILAIKFSTKTYQFSIISW